ncbi:DUF4811 domain-containing protein [Pediococcus inopinatus]|uniref:DUF4811 domain-containing protein n=1 Tax=Pediococcus inopinatus TaxID=114090 RepID=A0ABZ0Q3G3_9LACO|nr:DUF4811 domain-containing protein [Pediococcus inopinatus]WPC17061.1 DUF4811 domain-containing protein [Pediococcus inopinatus]WPC19819.1 DUF4811 domain-containing protein [Pediococcus inopinatus]WPC21516.1 DUF4811 domain-containing protein [Pediococcus inopinatus]
MIIISIIIAALLLFISMAYVSNATWRNILSTIFAVIIIVCAIFMVRNDREHYGMHKVDTTETTDLISVSPSKEMKMLLYEPVGTAGKEKVYIYKKNESQKKPTTTNPDPSNTTNTIKTVSGTPTVKTTTTRWEYKNDTYRFWFGIAGNGHKLIGHHNTFNINKDWLTLSSAQAKKLQKLAKQQNSASAKKEAETYVKATVTKSITAAMKKDPKMSASEQKALTAEATKKATAAYKKQAMAKLVEEAKK